MWKFAKPLRAGEPSNFLALYIHILPRMMSMRGSEILAALSARTCHPPPYPGGPTSIARADCSGDDPWRRVGARTTAPRPRPSLSLQPPLPPRAPARARVNGEGGAIRTSGMRERVRVRMGVSGPDRSGRALHAAWRPHTFGPGARLGQPV